MALSKNPMAAEPSYFQPAPLPFFLKPTLHQINKRLGEIRLFRLLRINQPGSPFHRSSVPITDFLIPQAALCQFFRIEKSQCISHPLLYQFPSNVHKPHRHHTAGQLLKILIPPHFQQAAARISHDAVHPTAVEKIFFSHRSCGDHVGPFRHNPAFV